MTDFPDQPLHSSKARLAIIEALRNQDKIQWDFICTGWFMDYLMPASKRWLKDIGNEWIMDHEQKVFNLCGDGRQEITLTSVRDTASATLALLQVNDAPWSEFAYLEGQTLAPRELLGLL